MEGPSVHMSGEKGSLLIFRASNRCSESIASVVEEN